MQLWWTTPHACTVDFSYGLWIVPLDTCVPWIAAIHNIMVSMKAALWERARFCKEGTGEESCLMPRIL